MKNYATYTLEDFAGDDDFRNWVKGNREGDIFWKEFLEQHPEKADLIRQASQIIRSSDVADEALTEREIRYEVERFLERATKIHHKKEVFVNFRWWLVAAATVAIAFFAGWQLLFQQRKAVSLPEQPVAEARLVQTVNESDEPIRLVLEDRSVIVLSPDSRLRYPSEFKGADREVYLTGEASFSVTHSSRPFMVYTGDMVTKVLGTRFVVRAFDKDKKISVQVQSGKVSVYSTKQAPSANVRERNGVILTANQAAIFEKELQQVTKTLVANPIVVLKENKVVNHDYDEVPLPEILRELEKVYGIAIQFDQESFKKCRITASLSNETLYEKLDLLCKTVSASYEIVDGQIAISGNGCH
jgi:transmembrane sensor